MHAERTSEALQPVRCMTAGVGPAACVGLTLLQDLQYAISALWRQE